MTTNWWYRIVCLIIYPFFRLFFPFRVHGLENVPRDRPVVFCANHAHAADPFLICLSLPLHLPMRIMAKKELMELPVLGWLLKKVGVFAVDRGNTDLTAVKTAIKAVRNGQNLLVFPEGTRVEREGDATPKGGVVMIAMRTGAQLLPVYCGKRHKFLRRTHIVFGEPFEAKTETRHGTAEEYQHYADEVVRRAYALGREWEKGK